MKTAIGLLLILGLCTVADAQGRADFGAIEGLVYSAADGTPLEAATVEVPSAGLATTTDAGGIYRFPEVPTGTCTVSAVKAGFHSTSSNWGTLAVVRTGETARVDIPLIPESYNYGLLDALVVDADSPSPPGLNFPGAPIPGATVSCSGVTAVTDEHGHCWLLLPAGDVDGITVTAAGYGTHTRLGVHIGAGGITRVALRLTHSTATIWGQVSDAETQAPMAGVTVTVTKYQEPWGGASRDTEPGLYWTMETVQTSVDGTYRFSDLPLDAYTTECTAPPGYEARAPAQVTLTAVGEVERVDFQVQSTRYGSLSGRVTEAATGARIANAVVAAGTVQTLTAADGSYVLEGITAGTHTVSARATGHWWSVVPGVVVKEGRTMNQDFALSPQASAGSHFGPTVALPSTGSMAWADYDGDGYADLYLSGGAGWYDEHSVMVGSLPTLLHNNHDGTFSDVTAEAGISREHIEFGGAAWGDYDNDGRPDLFQAQSVNTGEERPEHLYHSDGNGHFTDVAEGAGLGGHRHGETVAWCDYDGDSWLDLSIGHGGDGVITVYHNNRDGTFTSVGKQIGMVPPSGYSAGFQCDSIAWGDCNGDRWPDVVGGGSGGLDTAIPQPLMFANLGGQSFAGGTIESPVQDRPFAVVVLADFDNDGRLDCLVQDANLSALLKNGAGGSYGEAFGDVAASVGLSGLAAWGNAGAWADYDNDGYADLLQTSVFHAPLLDHNNAGTSFTEVGAAEGIATFSVTHVVTWADVDRDGGMDLAVGAGVDTVAHDVSTSRLFPNVGATGNWLRVRALTSRTGDATDPMVPVRDAIGARVELNAHNDGVFPPLPGLPHHHTAPVLVRLIDGGSGWHSQSEPVAQFGIPADGPVSVRVIFPDGSVVTHRDVALNQEIVIRDVPEDRYQLFSDVELDSWAAAFIQAALEAGIVHGYPDGRYQPSGQVTRDQMAAYIARAMAGGDAMVPTGPDEPAFADVPADHWAYRYVEYCRANDVVQGYWDGYRPDEVVNRGQMAVYVARAVATPTGDAGVPEVPAGTQPTFTDVNGGNEWAWCYKYVEYCAAAGVVQGYWDSSYRPQNAVTREQMAVYVAKAFDLL